MHEELHTANLLKHIPLMGSLQLCYVDLKAVCEQHISAHRAKLPAWNELLKAGNNRVPFTPTEMVDSVGGLRIVSW